MAARRLIVVMLVLLGLSTLVAALVPTPQPSGGGPGSETGPATNREPSRPPGSAPPGGAGLVTARIEVSPRAPEVVRVKPGQRLVLLVGGPVGDDISIPAFGLTETMTPTSPARFDLIVDRAGRFPIRAFAADRVVGTIASRW
ncbi:MAG: hypothetical protein ACXWZM_04820 [Solirubrobacterales bacterium]